MTPRQREAAPDSTAMRFLLEDFIEVPDGDEGNETAAALLQARAARVFLPGPQRGGVSLQQGGLMGLPAATFQELRRDVRDWLRSLVIYTHVGHSRTLNGPLRLSLISVRGKPDRLRAPIIEGPPLDVFWFYLGYLLSRVGLTRIGVCRAPKSKRDPGQRDPELCGETEPCGHLFLRRGTVKVYCSDSCRARVATRRARGGKDDRSGHRVNAVENTSKRYAAPTLRRGNTAGKRPAHRRTLRRRIR